MPISRFPATIELRERGDEVVAVFEVVGQAGYVLSEPPRDVQEVRVSDPEMVRVLRRLARSTLRNDVKTFQHVRRG